MNFRNKWLASVDEKNSIFVAGLDPAPFYMGRGDKGLPEGMDKRKWAIEYIKAVAPFCSGVKPNLQYWVAGDSAEFYKDMQALLEIGELVHELGMVYILDAKLADIGSTNQAGMIDHLRKGFDAVTLAPYAGNMKQAAEQAHELGIGLITMCLMSNPEYETEKNMWVPIGEQSGYIKGDIEIINHKPHVRKYIQLAHDARAFGLDGIVIGAPSETNHISAQEVKDVKYYVGSDTLVLMPGYGAQGGQPDIVLTEFMPELVMMNVGRGWMFPNGSNSTPEEQAAIAKYDRDLINQRFR